MTHYERFLVKTTDEIFEAACKEGMTWLDLAAQAGLAPTTVYNLGNRVTVYPQLRTIFLLAKACRMNVCLIKKELRLEAKSQIREAVTA